MIFIVARLQPGYCSEECPDGPDNYLVQQLEHRLFRGFFVKSQRRITASRYITKKPIRVGNWSLQYQLLP